jgi:glycosyltransferase involved in cell wall biosynthesis
MRILHVSPYGEAAWAYGGIPRVVGALSRGLAKCGHSVTVCTTDVCDESSRLPADFAPPSTPDAPIHCVFPNVSNRLAYRQQAFIPVGLRQFLRNHAREFDVAHLHACRNLPGTIAAHYLRRAGVPYVLQPNGTAPIIERRHTAKRVFDIVAGRQMMKTASRLIAVSAVEQRQLAELGAPPESVRLVSNPIDLSEFAKPIVRGRFRRQYGIGNEPMVLFLGKITPRKNVDTLVRAFTQLTHPHAKLVIAGNDMGGGCSARLLASDLGIDKRAVFTGLLTGPARIEALADADVVVYASEHEIFGLVPFEALLAGTPVVVADDSGCGNLLGATGGAAIVRVNDVRALALAIDEVLANPALWRLKAERAQRQIRASYGSDVVCEQLEGVYKELVRRNSGDALNGVPYEDVNHPNLFDAGRPSA